MSRSAQRELIVSYNDFEIGGSSELFQLDGNLRIIQEHEESSLSWDTIITASTESEFRAAVEDFEEKMATPWQKVEVKQGSATLLFADPADATALDTLPTVEKIGDVGDTGRTRVYRCSMTWGRPATYHPTSEGLRSSAVTVAFTPSRRKILTISGVYTAISATRARAQYDGKIVAFQAAVVTAIGGTYDLMNEVAEEDTNDSLLNFSRTLEEIIFGQGGSALDDPAIISQQLTVMPTTPSIFGADGFDTAPLTTVRLTYAAAIDRNVTTDLEAKYQSIRSFLLQQAENFFEGGLVIATETPSFDPDNNRISAVIDFVGSGSREYRSSAVEVNDDFLHGLRAVHAWTGRPFTKFIYEAAASYTRTIRVTVEKEGLFGEAEAIVEIEKVAGKESLEGISGGVGGGGGEGADGGGDGGLDPRAPPNTLPLSSSQGKWFPVSRRVNVTPLVREDEDGNRIETTRLVGETQRFWAENVAGTTAF